MTDKDMVPFHIWAAKQQDIMKGVANVFQERAADDITDKGIIYQGLTDIAETLSTLLNVMATEAASRFEADVKGLRDDRVARPPTPSNIPKMTWYVFQCMPADKNRAPYRVFGAGRDPEEAEEQLIKTEGDEHFLVGWM